MSKNRRYLLGVSGGRDSMALLYSLLEAGYRNLVLCHLNHGLRGRASGQDAAFVRRVAKKLSLPCMTARVDVGQLARDQGVSVELAARSARHRFFRQCAIEHRCQRVLLAHHADDQAETILFNLLRGSNGLKGMRFCVRHSVLGKELEILRPLLGVTRGDIDDYLARQQVSYREDASNAEAIATRNRLRNEAIPLLNEMMGRDIRPALLRAEAISQSQRVATGELLDTLQLEDPQQRLFLPKLKNLSPALQTTVIHRYLKERGIGDINHDLLCRCTRLITDPSMAKINLPGGKFLRRKEKRIFIS